MSIANTNRENLQEYSMIELAILVLEKTNKALNYREIFNQVADIKGYSESERQSNLALFYTDLNLDGRFLTLGGGEWGLKKWYSVEQIDEVIQIEATPKKRKKKKKVVDPVEDDPIIDDTDEDLTEVPLDIVGAAYKNTINDDDEDTLTLSDDIIDEEDFDDYDEDLDDGEDEDLDDEDDYDDEDEL